MFSHRGVLQADFVKELVSFARRRFSFRYRLGYPFPRARMTVAKTCKNIYNVAAPPVASRKRNGTLAPKFSPNGRCGVLSKFTYPKNSPLVGGPFEAFLDPEWSANNDAGRAQHNFLGLMPASILPGQSLQTDN